MYRQIWIDSRDVDYQRILWRFSPSDPIIDYRLLTVTYGMASAPFLAMRVLKQLAHDKGEDFPLVRDALLNDFYVDDCLIGADTLARARQLRDQLNLLMQRGGFVLRKWASNAPALLEGLQTSNHGLACSKNLENDNGMKLLGLSWSPGSDSFHFSIEISPPSIVTKRSVLSVIARLHDPLGWFGPVIIVAKIFMQSLWCEKLDWDTPLSNELRQEWLTYYASLPGINNIVIPRWVGTTSYVTDISLHAFSDASSVAYATVVYIRVVSLSGSVTVTNLTCKTRVGPVKRRQIAQLELCGATLSARVLNNLRNIPCLSKVQARCWTDSTAVLHWLAQHASKWPIFVANRVSEIHRTLPQVTWSHVPGPQNPADIASRGVTINQLVNHDLWWRGPTWLSEPSGSWLTYDPLLNNVSPEQNDVSHHPFITHHAALDIDSLPAFHHG